MRPVPFGSPPSADTSRSWWSAAAAGCSRAFWLSRRVVGGTATVRRRRAIVSIRARTAPLLQPWIRPAGLDRRLGRASIAAATASRPSRSAVASVATSATFRAPNANQLRSASSSSVSASSEYGTCSVEHDVETATVPRRTQQRRERAQRRLQVGRARCCGRRQRRPPAPCRPARVPRRPPLVASPPPGRHRSPPPACGPERAERRPVRRNKWRRKSLAGRQRSRPGVALLRQPRRIVEDVGHQYGLVELHPLDALGGQHVEQLRVDRAATRRVASIGAPAPSTALLSARNVMRPDDHRPGRDALLSEPLSAPPAPCRVEGEARCRRRSRARGSGSWCRTTSSSPAVRRRRCPARPRSTGPVRRRCPATRGGSAPSITAVSSIWS